MGNDSLPFIMAILYGFAHCTDQGNVRCAVFDQAGDCLSAWQGDKGISRNACGVGTQGVFKKFGIMSAYPKDKQVARIADNRVLELVIRNLREELVREREKEFVLAGLGKGRGERLRLISQEALEFVYDEMEGDTLLH